MSYVVIAAGRRPSSVTNVPDTDLVLIFLSSP